MSCSDTECLWKRVVSGTESRPWAAVNIVGIRKPDAERVPMGGTHVPFQRTLWALWRGHWLRVDLPGSLLGAASTCSRCWRFLPPRGRWSCQVSRATTRPRLPDLGVPEAAPQPVATGQGPSGGSAATQHSRRPWSPLVPEPCSVLSTDDKTSPFTHSALEVEPWSHHVLTACSCCIDRGGGTCLAIS